MKKSLFLILTILSIFLCMDNVNALTFEVNGVATEVNEENLIYYIYSQRQDYFEKYDYFYLVDYGTTYYSYYFTNYPTAFTSITNMGRYGCSKASADNPCTYIYGVIYNSSQDYKFGTNYFTETTKTSQFNISNYSNCHVIASNFDSITYNKDYEYTLLSKQDLVDYFGVKPIYTITYYLNNEIYKTFEVEENSSHDLLTYDYNKGTHNFSGWSYDDTLDLTNITSDITIKGTLIEKDVIPVYIDFPITKIEFYTLLVEVGVLIMMLFLKWCFPMKGGKNI